MTELETWILDSKIISAANIHLEALKNMYDMPDSNFEVGYEELRNDFVECVNDIAGADNPKNNRKISVYLMARELKQMAHSKEMNKEYDLARELRTFAENLNSENQLK